VRTTGSYLHCSAIFTGNLYAVLLNRCCKARATPEESCPLTTRVAWKQFVMISSYLAGIGRWTIETDSWNLPINTLPQDWYLYR
jgi:hypothetical protein